jgi:hypothetical protein
MSLVRFIENPIRVSAGLLALGAALGWMFFDLRMPEPIWGIQGLEADIVKAILLFSAMGLLFRWKSPRP